MPSNKSASTSSTFAIFSTAINPNTLYYVDVQAINASGNSTFTSLGSTPTWANVPTVGTPPVVLSTQITANWTDGGNPAGTNYLVKISLDSGFSSVIGSTTTANFSFVFQNLASNTTYFMQVSAVNLAGIITAPSSLPPALTFATVPSSAAPTNVQANQITANWGRNGNAVGTTYIAKISP